MILSQLFSNYDGFGNTLYGYRNSEKMEGVCYTKEGNFYGIPINDNQVGMKICAFSGEARFGFLGTIPQYLILGQLSFFFNFTRKKKLLWIRDFSMGYPCTTSFSLEFLQSGDSIPPFSHLLHLECQAPLKILTCILWSG